MSGGLIGQAVTAAQQQQQPGVGNPYASQGTPVGQQPARTQPLYQNTQQPSFQPQYQPGGGYGMGQGFGSPFGQQQMGGYGMGQGFGSPFGQQQMGGGR